MTRIQSDLSRFKWRLRPAQRERRSVKSAIRRSAGRWQRAPENEVTKSLYALANSILTIRPLNVKAILAESVSGGDWRDGRRSRSPWMAKEFGQFIDPTSTNGAQKLGWAKRPPRRRISRWAMASAVALSVWARCR